MAKARPEPPEHNGYYKDHRLSIDEAREKLKEALTELLKKE